MKVSIILPAFNEEKILPATLAAVNRARTAFQWLKWEHEVILVDNNSTDGTARIGEKYGAKVVFEPVNQISRARNRGAAAATGEWLIFIDADSFPTRNLFFRVSEEMEEADIVGGGLALRLDDSPGVGHLGVRIWNAISSTMTWAAGSFIFIRSDAFRAIGGFSGDLFFAEELHLSEKLNSYARARNQKMVIIRDQALLTSGRKFRKYSIFTHLGLLFRLFLSGGKMIKDREQCGFWYDSGSH